MLLEEKNLCLAGFGSFNEQHEKTFQARKRVISRGKRSLLLPKNHAALQAALPSRIKWHAFADAVDEVHPVSFPCSFVALPACSVLNMRSFAVE